MCRNIKTLHNFAPPATEDEIRASSLQFVRKLSGFTKPSKANEEAFNQAVDEVAHVAHHLLSSLVTNSPPRNREVEALKARARSAKRFASVAGIIALLALVLPIASAQSDKVKQREDDLIMRTPPPADDPATSITIHEEVDFTATPQRVYEALLDAKQFIAFSGGPAQINRDVGGAFSLFGGHIIGRNVELEPNQRIVQAWRVVDWPEGAYSIAKFELKAQGTGTHLIFDHVGFPEGLHDHLLEGWDGHYWEQLKKYLH